MMAENTDLATHGNSKQEVLLQCIVSKLWSGRLEKEHNSSEKERVIDMIPLAADHGKQDGVVSTSETVPGSTGCTQMCDSEGAQGKGPGVIDNYTPDTLVNHDGEINVGQTDKGEEYQETGANSFDDENQSIKNTECLSPTTVCRGNGEKNVSQDKSEEFVSAPFDEKRELMSSFDEQSQNSNIPADKRGRVSYTREEKLAAVTYYYENGKNKCKTCKKFNIHNRTINRWIRGEERIKALPEGKRAERYKISKNSKQATKRTNKNQQNGKNIPADKRMRVSYTREEKLAAVTYYYENGKNKSKTCKKFNIHNRTINRWIRGEERIKALPEGKRAERCRPPAFPDIESVLYDEYKTTADEEGIQINDLWFRDHARAILKEQHPGSDFKFSQGWLQAFKRRYSIASSNTKKVKRKTSTKDNK